MEKELICIICPKGCSLKINAKTLSEAEASDVTGHLCKRGPTYAVNECRNPVRTLTTTIRLSGPNRRLAPVKSAGPLPKGLLSACMEVINSHAANAPLKVGDIVIRNILDTGIDIVSTSNISGEDTE